ncbi:methyltransferase family protein [Synechococcus elongatus]|uniref:Isoprenylcysteine carboxyl methyltransferase n=2 Tax=Synechococcus elongatus TaxID=32046 RepID=Q31NV5_SYNE7|nr:isoprenylcysteine carboxylmethyltransferase family protein [Synechococcus elongatus]ABB57264.1 conserved hypothetical protein [Synechococcus elongatus PCC 7942 = FACHB-805]AJD58222.1 hypothetical protein M744_10470 [Synechococcus elongatus UTEX 2973]MBD2587670.1 isoprenylcysteine carboxylmethyltransferase family protein [Synechococcus elongatus FACHB-242]MBD2688551.1 isoprenylcysteine carboxylmethyltransferase family protein [Synechococcus elongatus FACHB-1061]MBD2707622.1 isoprenylcysteine
MALFQRWGFDWKHWYRGDRGEYWLLAQLVLLVALVLVPRWAIPIAADWIVWRWAIAIPFLIMGAGLAIAGLRFLGDSLSPLPAPHAESTLVQTGIYAWIRHPLYSGLMIGSLGWAIALWSLSQAAVSLALIGVLIGKARLEERWLRDRYSDYVDYQTRVKAFIPGLI